MCSLTVTEYLASQLVNIGPAQAKFIEDNMSRHAWAANIETPGILDRESNHLQAGFAVDLRQAGIRKQRIGRHRIFYTGQHTECNYSAFFVKSYKKKDDNQRDDNNVNFHAVVREALSDNNVVRVQRSPEEIAEGLQVPEATPAWQDADWFKRYALLPDRTE